MTILNEDIFGRLNGCLRPYFNLLSLGLIYNIAFLSFRSEDIESFPFFFRTIQMTLVLFMFSITYMNRKRFNMDDIDMFLSMMISIISIMILVIFSTISMYEDNEKWIPVRASLCFANIEYMYSLIPKSAMVFMLLKEAGNNIAELLPQ